MIRKRSSSWLSVVVSILTVWIGATHLVGDDCRRLKEAEKGTIRLDGLWKDNSNNREVEIHQTAWRRVGDSSNLNSAEVVATYVHPVRCSHPDDQNGVEASDFATQDGKYHVLNIDFKGEFVKHEIDGSLGFCKWEDRGSGAHTTGIEGTVLHLTVDPDGRSMKGWFVDAISHQHKDITLTLEKPYAPSKGSEPSPYYPKTVMHTKAATAIYSDTSTSSTVKLTVPIGTKVMMESATLGPDGLPVWYYISDDEHAVPHWWGFIPASQVRCSDAQNGGPPS